MIKSSQVKLGKLAFSCCEKVYSFEGVCVCVCVCKFMYVCKCFSLQKIMFMHEIQRRLLLRNVLYLQLQ